MPTTSQCIATYLRAKDENRPHLMKFAFAETATLETIVETSAISFPPLTQGLNKIAQVLVRDFVNTYENIYTFCFADSPPKGQTGNHTCRWLVGMSDKASGSVRVGCGQYDWSFQTNQPYLAERLAITIKEMEVLPSDCLQPVIGWLAGLPYPWCPASEAIKRMPDIAALQVVRKFVEHESMDLVRERQIVRN